MAEMDHIAVCIPTFRRNQLLERLLRSLAKQDTGGLFEVSVVVVDNDTAGPAREMVSHLAAELKLDITYDIEAERNIAAVRNHALALAKGNYIGIIDDDEFAPPTWLLSLYRAIQTFQVDGALGPVYPFFGQAPPGWLVKSELCELPAHRTGTLLHWSQTRTGNVLLRKDVFDQHSLRFDTEFKTGGSDQDFFRRAMALGYRFVAVEEAPVYEVVPPARWARKYWIKRALVNGYNARRYAIGTGTFRQVALTLKSLVAAVLYTGALPLCACVGQHRLMQCAEKSAYHISRFSASFGVELWKRRDF
jgi:succinoglycan biosynthesis protein ExoM